MKKNLIKSPATGMPNWLNSKFGGRIKINSTKTFAMALMLFAAGSAYAAPTSNDFVTEWTPTGSTITIPTSGGGYNYNIEYKNITTNSAYTTINGVTGSYTISGLTAGDDYEVRISEAVPGSGFPYFYSLGLNAGERADLKEIVQWGTIHWSSMTSSFRNLKNMELTASDVPDLSGVSDLSFMFLSSTGMTGSTANWAWNTATITNMKSVFNDAQAFNGDVSSWNTASVTNMNSMFRGAGQFNYNIGGWNTSSVTDMGQMFQNANSFDQNIGSWNLSNLTTASAMFNAAPGNGMGCANMGLTLTGWANAGTASNIALGLLNREVPNDVWNLLGVPYLKTVKLWTIEHEPTVTTCQGSYFITKWQPTSGYIKIPASNYTGPYNYSVTIFDLSTLLPAFSAPVVNGTYTSPPLNPVNQYYALVSENVSGGFPHFNALGLNSGEASDILEIVQWGPNHWKTMVSAFRALPNLDLTATDAPDLSNVTDLNFMFLNSKGLTGTLGNWVWNTSNVTTMKGTFNDAQKFNGDLSEWNTSNVTDMNSMFRGAGLFNYDISDWNTSNVTTMKQMFQNAHSFNQNLEDWDLSSLTDAAFMFNANPGQGMDCDNLTNTLIGWGANASTPNGVTLGAKNRYYASGADAGLLAKSWTITDASGTCTPAPLVPVVAKMDNVAFGAYPNPSNGMVNLSSGAFIGESYVVTDMYGRQIINGKINSAVTTIDLSNYAKGLYVIRVADKAVKVTIK